MIKFNRPTLHAYDPQTKEHRGTAKPDIDMASLARDELVFLQPAFTTEVAPPDVPRGSAAVWTGTDWTLVADHRNETWWQGEIPVRIADFGDPLAAGLTRKPVRPEPPPKDAKEVRAERRLAILAKLQEVTSVGASFVALKKPVPQEWMDKHAEIVAELQATDSET